MKKITSCFAVASLVTSLAFAPSAIAEEQGDIHKVVVSGCTFYENNQGLLNKGSCVSYFYAVGPVYFCKFLKEENNLQYFGFNTQGECVYTLSRAGWP